MSYPTWLNKCYLCLLISLSLPLRAQVQLDVVYPEQNGTIYTSDSVFVFGRVSPAHAYVTIDGQAPRRYSQGRFLGMTKLQPGHTSIEVRASLDGEQTGVSRNVYTPTFYYDLQREGAYLDTSFVYPRHGYALTSEDRAGLIIKAGAGNKVYARFAGLTDYLRLREKRLRRSVRWNGTLFPDNRAPYMPRVPGFFTAQLPLADDMPAGRYAIDVLSVQRGDSLQFRLPATLTVLDSSANLTRTILKTRLLGDSRRRDGFVQLLATGVKVKVKAFVEEQALVQLSEQTKIWVPQSLLARTPDRLVSVSSLRVARNERLPKHIRMRFLLFERLPVTVDQDVRRRRINLKFYGVFGTPAWLRNDHNDPMIEQVEGKPLPGNVFQISIQLTKKPVWGYQVFYEGTDLFLDIKRPPVMTGGGEKPLQGLRICVDAGHFPDDGAKGPSGFSERELTPEYGRVLSKHLTRLGASVVLTRTHPDSGSGIYSRPLIAQDSKADLFISLHFNSLPDGANPFKSRGTSTFYYQPHSRQFAATVQRRLVQATGLRDAGIRRQNFVVCRDPAMPAILLEPAYLMQPDEEELILSPRFRDRMCEYVAQGIVDFVKRYR